MRYLLLALLVLPLGCTSPERPEGASGVTQDPGQGAEEPWLEDVAASSGIDFVHEWGHGELFLMPEVMTGGAALFDLDGDGDLDAYLVQSGYLMPGNRTQPGNRLYRNRGDGTFEALEDTGAEDTGYGMGVATGDVDGDGRVDLFVTNVGPNVLLRNRGDGTFEDITERAGVGDPGWGASAAFFDFDRDGDLDLFVTNYLDWSQAREIDCYNNNGWQVFCSPQAYDSPVPDLLYRNEGDGTFTNVSTSTGIGAAPGTGLGVVVADFDDDGWADVFVANDGMPDHLWVNRRDGTFREDGVFAGCALDQDGRAKAGMGVAAGDLDHDGDTDLMVSNLRQETDSLFLNSGGLFADATVARGLAAISEPFTRFGTGWIDFDNDGLLDLYQANGRVIRQSTQITDDPHAEPNLLFRGRADGFREVRPRGGTASPLVHTSRAAAFGDLDGDGGIDILVANLHHPVYVLRNVVPDRGHWISFRLLDRNGAPALGARLRARAGSKLLSREVRSAFSYLAASDPSLHFGLGEATGVTGVEIRWPDGSQTSHGDFEGGGVAEIRRGE